MRHVTGVLRDCGLVKPLPMSQTEASWYMERGSMIHAATALLDQGVLDWSTVDHRIVPYVEAYVSFREQVGGTVYRIELPVTHKTLDYTGTLDRIYRGTMLSKHQLLVDIKTTDAPPWTALQLMAYLMAYRSQTRSRAKIARGAVSLQDTGKWKWHPYDRDAADKAAWLACLTLDRWVREVELK
jgi:hypothetical protein